MFRLGLFENITKKLGGKPTDDATKLFRRQDVAELLNTVIPRRKSGKAKTKPSDQFGEIVSREARIRETRDLLGNSRTAFRLESQEDFNRMAAFGARMRQNGLMPAILDTAALELQRFFGMREDVATKVAEMLTSTDQSVIRATIERLAQSVGREQAQQAAGIVFGAIRQLEQAATLGIGQQGAANVGRVLSGGDSGSSVEASRE